jgi:hypothetical protein
MVLPLLFSFLGGGLAKAGVLGAAGSFLANPLIASALGSGIGTLVETGDPKKALLGGLGSFAGGSLMSNLMGGTAAGALQKPLAGQSVVGSGANAMTTGTPLYAQPGMTGSALLPPAPQAGGLLGGRMGDVASAGMEFAKSGAGIGSLMGGMLPTMLQKPPRMPQEAGPDLSAMRPMQREARMPGAGFQPGVSGEFDYGVSTPYTTDYMQRYAPQRRAMGGFVDNPYAQNYAEERGQMLAGMGLGQAPMAMADGGMVEDPRFGREIDYGFAMPVSTGPISTAPASAQNTKGSVLDRVFSLQRLAPESAGSGGSAMLSLLFGRKRDPEPTTQNFTMERPNFTGQTFAPRPPAEPTQFRLSSTQLNEMLGDRPFGMAQGGTVQRMVPGYGPVMMQAGGIAEMGAMPEPAAQPNEREVISAAVAAIMGQHPQPEVALGIFLQQYGEEAFRDLVDRVQSGEFQDTQERFANGENGEVVGPGDGSGTDDMVPAVVDGQGDVLLSDGEFVLRKDATDALNAEFGPEFMDRMNSAGARAPEVVKQMVAS